MKMNEVWFTKLFGFAEPRARSELYQRLYVEGENLIDRATRRSWRCGTLEVCSLAELRDRAGKVGSSGSEIRVEEVISDAQDLHVNYPGAMIQAASQFNLLEMSDPDVTPDEGVAVYGFDNTQGPACAVACGSGTVYRNYFARVGNSDQLGQTADRQINTLEDIEAALSAAHDKSDTEFDSFDYWEVKNGYLHSSSERLALLNKKLGSFSEEERDVLGSKLRIGIQWDSQVTLPCNEREIFNHTVSQAYCAAIPIGYNDPPTDEWSILAKMILDATYEATFLAALEQFEKRKSQNTQRQKLFLTLVGGGVFDNPLPWIIEAIDRNLERFENHPLDVAIVSYGESKPIVQELVQLWRET